MLQQQTSQTCCDTFDAVADSMCMALQLCGRRLTATFQSTGVVHHHQEVLTRTGPVSEHVCHIEVVLWEGCKDHHSEGAGMVKEV